MLLMQTFKVEMTVAKLHVGAEGVTFCVYKSSNNVLSILKSYFLPRSFHSVCFMASVVNRRSWLGPYEI
jgi:hypothetical protein